MYTHRNKESMNEERCSKNYDIPVKLIFSSQGCTITKKKKTQVTADTYDSGGAKYLFFP